MSTERLAYTPALRPAHDSLNIIVVGENDGESAKARRFAKKRHAPLFSCAGAGEGV